MGGVDLFVLVVMSVCTDLRTVLHIVFALMAHECV